MVKWFFLLLCCVGCAKKLVGGPPVEEPVENFDWDSVRKLDVNENGELIGRKPSREEIDEQEVYILFMKGVPIDPDKNRIVREVLKARNEKIYEFGWVICLNRWGLVHICPKSEE